MTADTVRCVYAYVHDYRGTCNNHLPSPREAYDALTVTKRQYLEVLHWLERHGLITRGNGHAWRFARLAVRRCRCGTQFTPVNVRLGTAHGRVFMRADCGTCLCAKDSPRRRKNYAAAAFSRVLSKQAQS